ncbi:HAT dimerisation domain, C-terminal and Ribonuclease H-like domain-containing protein [Strongyloides ratti]|uniref:HAT dimerisation domain, C-terminal and Ribonuclease H-like domain-containing protein n=1 Tax=Strongyloides ratti TaxID=34506 RepID=A0A090MWD9_STRRB|nr:HAT dimerisation domain, C-terminal and Ribonuclease H-like domain-containing protein [Strongyloides ratti]CEF63654.1 HAT dimerisation domain, C-terminal and Ribonuclease H-like domain-containing protein [Strongyloides ratti]
MDFNLDINTSSDGVSEQKKIRLDNVDGNCKNHTENGISSSLASLFPKNEDNSNGEFNVDWGNIFSKVTNNGIFKCEDGIKKDSDDTNNSPIENTTKSEHIQRGNNNNNNNNNEHKSNNIQNVLQNMNNPIATMFLASHAQNILRGNGNMSSGQPFNPMFMPFIPGMSNCENPQQILQFLQQQIGVNGNDPHLIQMYMQQTQNYFKSLLQNPENKEALKQTLLASHRGSSQTPMSTTPPTVGIPGAVAVAASPAAALFPEDDWSWHRNPAAAIRSGGTNKQTPVWKYFVYNKQENISRCIIGDCSYMLKGPHTSTLACHLKKHPAEFAEFQRLKQEYTRERSVSQIGNPTTPTFKNSTNNNYNNFNNGGNYNKMRGNFNAIGGGIKNNQLKQQPDMNNIWNTLSAKAHSQVTNYQNENNNKMSNTQNKNQHIQLNGNMNNNMLGNVQYNPSELLNIMTANISSFLPTNNNERNDNKEEKINIKNDEKETTSPGSVNNENINSGDNSSSENNDSSIFSRSPSNILSGNQGNEDKWMKEDKKQKDLEVKLAMMLGTTQLPLKIIQNSDFRNFLKMAQPKFDIPVEVKDIDEILNNKYQQMTDILKKELSKLSSYTLMIDLLKISPKSIDIFTSRKRKYHETTMLNDNECHIQNSNESIISFPPSIQSDVTIISDDSCVNGSSINLPNLQISPATVSCSSSISPSQISSTPSTYDEKNGTFESIKRNYEEYRLCVSVTYYNKNTGKIEIILLAVKPIIFKNDEFKIILSETVKSILQEYNMDIDKASKILTHGLTECGIDDNDLFTKQMMPYNFKLYQFLKKVLQSNSTVQNLKKAFSQMMNPFLCNQQNIDEFNKHLSEYGQEINQYDSFFKLASAVLTAKEVFLTIFLRKVNFNTSSTMMNEEKWNQLDQLIQLLKMFNDHTSRIIGNELTTIDKVVPSLMQLKVSLERGYNGFEDLCYELKNELNMATANILDTESPNFDSTFIEATALNTQLAVLLDDSQIACAKTAIEKALTKRMNFQLNENISIEQSTNVQSVSSPSLSSASSTSSEASSNNTGSNTISHPASSLFPDLLQAANQRRKQLQDNNKNNENKKNIMAEVVVQSYFDNIYSSNNQAFSVFESSSIDNQSLNSNTSINTQLPPLEFWRSYSSKSFHLSEYAIELLSIPVSTLSIQKIFHDDDHGSSLSLLNKALGDTSTSIISINLDSFAITKALETPAKFERDVFIKFNKNLSIINDKKII